MFWFFHINYSYQKLYLKKHFIIKVFNIYIALSIKFSIFIILTILFFKPFPKYLQVISLEL